MESRHPKVVVPKADLDKDAPLPKPAAPLPDDYLKMVCDLLQTNFDEGLKILGKIRANPQFIVQGEIMADEIVLAASIAHPDHIVATTVYASTDFDPKASAPTAEDLLGGCVDAIGQVLLAMLDPEFPDRIEQIADESLSALEHAPFEWTLVPVERFKVYAKVDKSNLSLERIADEWLRRNDPDLSDLERQTQAETEKLFVTGDKARSSGSKLKH